jgi:3',5'-cyclic AMP phosphodiesterase CpdA
VTQPFLLAQLSDPHIGAEWGGQEPAAGLAAVVEAIGSMRPGPDAVLVSGDIADNATDDEYALVRELLAPLSAPTYVLPGNDDGRDALRRHFGLPGTGAEPVQYSVKLGPSRLVVLDSTCPGADRGEFDEARLGVLVAELAAAPAVPTLIAMHHPPLITGSPAWDAICLSALHRQMLGDVVGRHRQVRRIVAGHVHRMIAGELARCPVLTVPSTFIQAKPSFGSGKLEFAAQPPGFAVHAFVNGELISQVQPVA